MNSVTSRSASRRLGRYTTNWQNHRRTKGKLRDAEAPERHEEATYSDGGKHILDITSVDAGAKQMKRWESFRRFLKSESVRGKNVMPPGKRANSGVKELGCVFLFFLLYVAAWEIAAHWR